MRASSLKFLTLFALFSATSPLCSKADVWMPSIFGDHMVLQKSIPLTVWGKADAGEKVTVSIGSQTVKTKADADGRWSVKLAPMKSHSKPLTMTVTGNNILKFSDVLGGDVWVASGQSNMEFGLGMAHNAAQEVPKADHPLMRLFIVGHAPSFTPQDDVPKPAMATNLLVGHWQLCSPDSVTKQGGWTGFSAVAYFFGKEIQAQTNQPLGLIQCPFGGMPVQAFTSLDVLKANPDFAPYVQAYQKELDASPAVKAAYPDEKAKFDKAAADWQAQYGGQYQEQLDAWQKQVDAAKASGSPLPPKPKPSVPSPTPPYDGNARPKTASSLFNGMIHPIIPYGIKGVIWYQGEANTGAPWDYDKLFATMIADWRARWGEGNFPFLYVQLANFMLPQLAPIERSGYAAVRDMQLRTLKVPNTAMAVAIDVGEAEDIHPRDKFDVGHRLALGALHLAYAQKGEWSGPIYDSMKVDGDKVRITFKHAESGLKIEAHPKISANDNPSAPAELMSFAISGTDRAWHTATAKIDGNSVVVSSDAVKDPVAVRYGWANNPKCFLYNGKGLPASPFRTDDWPDPMPTPAPTPAQPSTTSTPASVPTSTPAPTATTSPSASPSK